MFKFRIPEIVFPLLLIVAILSAGCGSLVYAAEGIKLQLTPKSVSQSVGSSFAVNINIQSPDKVTAADLTLNYNPTQLQFNSLTNGDFLPVVLAPGSSTPGKARIVLGANPTAVKAGNGLLARANFKIINNGNSKITVDPSTQVLILGNNTNMLKDSNSVSVSTNGEDDDDDRSFIKRIHKWFRLHFGF